MAAILSHNCLTPMESITACVTLIFSPWIETKSFGGKSWNLKLAVLFQAVVVWVQRQAGRKCMTGNWHFKRAISFLSSFIKCAFVLLDFTSLRPPSWWEKCVTFLACIYFFPLKGTYVSFWVVVVVVANSTIGDDLGVSASGYIMIHGRFLGDFFRTFWL